MQVSLHHGDDRFPNLIGLRSNRNSDRVRRLHIGRHISEEARFAR